MADNIDITPGAGATVATDEIAGRHYQLVKLVRGGVDEAIMEEDSYSVGVVSSVLPTGAATEATLANVETDLDTVISTLAAVDGHVDGLETLVGSTNTKLDTVIGHVDGIEGLIGTTNTSLTTIDGRVDGIETLLTAIDGHVDGIEGSVDGIEALIGTTNSTLTTIDGRVDGIEGQLTTITGHVDGIEALIGTTNSSLTTIDGRVDGVETLLTAIDGHVDGIEGTQASIVTSVQLIDDAIVADDAGFTPATTKVMMAGFQADETSTDSLDEGDGGAARMTLDRKAIVTQQPHTQGGLLVINNIDVDESEDDVKTSRGQLYSIYCYNATTSVLYLRFYNATAANTTVGSTATFLGPFPVPPLSAFTKDIPSGVEFDTALCQAATTGVAANDTGAPASNAMQTVLLYK